MRIHLLKFKRMAALFVGMVLSIPTLTYANWSITQLESLPGFATNPLSLNDSGQIVGLASSNGEFRSFMTGLNGVGITDLTSSLGISTVNDINSSGQITGSILTSDSISHPFISGPNAIGITDLGTLENSGGGVAVNNSGQVAGWYNAPGVSQHGFITASNGISMNDVVPAGSINTSVFDINASGQVTGNYDTNDGQQHAFITGANGVGVTNLTVFADATNSVSVKINDLGQIVGLAGISDLTGRAFVTAANGSNMMDLGTLGGHYSESKSINNHGEVIGIAMTENDANWHSFIYSHGGITDLSLLAPIVDAGWSNLMVTDINNNGQIVGSGIYNGENAGFLLSYTSDTIFNPMPIFIPDHLSPPPPIPEPQTYLMMLAGFVVIWLTLKQRTRRYPVAI